MKKKSFPKCGYRTMAEARELFGSRSRENGLGQVRTGGANFLICEFERRKSG